MNVNCQLVNWQIDTSIANTKLLYVGKQLLYFSLLVISLAPQTHFISWVFYIAKHRQYPFKQIRQLLQR